MKSNPDRNRTGTESFVSERRIFAAGYIGIDCIALPENFSGAAYYVYHLARNLLASPRAFGIAILCKPQHQDLFRGLLTAKDKIISIAIKHQAAKLYFYEFRLRPLLIREKITVFYATHYICPPEDPRYYLINTFHDMGFLLHPQYYPLIKKMYFGWRMRTFLARTDRAIAISQSTAAAISRLFPESVQKTSVVHSGADHLMNSEAPQMAVAAGKTKLPDLRDPFILAVNTFESRKNFPFIIRVFNYLKTAYKMPHKLLLIGQPANGLKAVLNEAAESPFKSEIHILHGVPVHELIDCYRRCDCFINASAYEGFGFTPLEAINFECAAFLYQNNAIAELLGDHPYILDHLDETRWGDFIQTELAGGFSGKISRTEIQHLTWQNTTEAVLKMLNQLIPAKEQNIAQ